MDIIKGILPMSGEFRDYLHDESKTTGSAASISFPTDEEEVRATLRHFNQKGIRVTVQGNRTGLTAASVPDGGHILSMERMCRVTGLRVSDGIAYLRVQPGVALITVRHQIDCGFDVSAWDTDSLTALEEYKKLPRQFFPPDPTESSASLGGMAACNSSGAKTYRYGPTRPYINGLRAVLSDGDVVELRRGGIKTSGREFSLSTVSGRVIRGRIPDYTMPKCKNASGYYAEDNMDLVDMFIGSDGTLGIITELELRLLPLPKVIWGINSFFATEEQAIGFVERVRHLDSAAAIEFFDGNALNIVRKHSGGHSVPDGFDCMIYTELHCDTDVEAYAAIRTLGKAMEEAGGDAEDSWAAHSLPDRERLLELRHAVPESVNAFIAERKRNIPTLAKVASDMAVPDGHFREVMEMYHRDLAAEGFQYAMWGHIGNNHIHVNVLPRSVEEMARGKAMFARWAKSVVEFGGTVSAEHGAGKNKAGLLPILYGEDGVRQMAELKRCLDPRCILGAGNLFPAEYV